jgi:hypothetical protein
MFALTNCDNNTDADDIYVEPILEEVNANKYDVIGYRLVVDRIQTSATRWKGYLTARASYDEEYIHTDEDLERHGKVVVYYQNDWYPGPNFNWNSGKIDDSFCDFFFNPDHLGKANIIFEGGFEAGLSNYGGRLVKCTQDANTQINIEDIERNPEGSVLFTSYEEPEIFVEITYHLEKMVIDSDCVYPEGKSSMDIFNVSFMEFAPKAPRYYTSSVTSSERMVMVQEPAKKMYPTPVIIKTNDNELFYSYGLKPKFVSDSEPYTPTFSPNIVIDDLHATECLLSINEDTGEALAISTAKTGVQLESVPNLQIIQYWEPLEVWRIPAGGTKSVTVTTSYGWEETSGHELATTLGIQVGPDWAQFTGELSETYSYSFTRNKSQEISVESSYSAPDDKNAVYVVWQKINEVRMVGQDGKIFSDPNYKFRSMQVARVPTEVIAEYAYLFDN